jgi:hypothetical protein
MQKKNSFLSQNRQGNILIEIEEVYSCYCSECHKSLSDGDFYVKGGHWSKPIICLSCYDHLFTHKCRRCNKSITFNRKKTKKYFSIN